MHTAIDAMQAAGVDPASNVTVGVDATPDALLYLREGKLGATIDQSPGKQVHQALEPLVGYIKNQMRPPQSPRIQRHGVRPASNCHLVRSFRLPPVQWHPST